MRWFDFLIGVSAVFLSVCITLTLITYDKEIDGSFSDALLETMFFVGRACGLIVLFVSGMWLALSAIVHG